MTQLEFTEIIERAKNSLESLRCPEPHNTGFGCCGCKTNDTIDDILNDLEEIRNG